MQHVTFHNIWQGSYVTLTFRRVSACNAFIFEVEMMRGAGDYLALSALVKKKERSLVSLAARSSQLEASVEPRLSALPPEPAPVPFF